MSRRLARFYIAKRGGRGYNTRVKISSLKIFALKLALFTTGLVYLALDLWVFHGPAYRLLHPFQTAAAEAPVAEVLGEPVTAAQLARYTAEQGMLSGRDMTDPKYRGSLLLGMVNNHMLRIRARYNDRNLPPCKEEAAAELGRLESRAQGAEDFAGQLASQGYTREHFAAKIEARLRELAQLERAIAPVTAVEDAALVSHYEQVKDELTIPESRPVKHIFLATLNKDAAAVKAAAEALLARITAGEEFAAVARECSEDERSAPQGGNLGTLYDDGSIPLEELCLFGEDALPASTPVLVQSRWGWHIVLAGPVTPAYTPGLDDCRDSLRTAIQSAQRELATDSYFDSGLQQGLHDKRIKFHTDSHGKDK